MSETRSRNLARIATGGVAAAFLLGSAATSASASAYPNITVAQAKTAVPAAKLLPGGVKIIDKVTIAGRTYGIPCLTKPKQITLPGASAAGAMYTVPGTKVTSPNYLIYNVSVAVFASPAKAAAGAALFTADEKTCPKTSTTTVDGIPETFTRSLLAKSKIGSWSGYRSIEHLSATGPAATIRIRAYETYLVRGNVVVSLEEVATETAANGAAQDHNRLVLTNLVLKNLSALR